MFAVLLIICVSVGIAYPFARNFWEERRAENAAEASLEASQTSVMTRPAATREELCPNCSRLNSASASNCVECGATMPVTNVASLWTGSEHDNLLREGIQAGALLAAMLLAMALANFLPVPGKILILLLTVCALGYRFMRVLYN